MTNEFTPNWRLDDGHQGTVDEQFHWIEGGCGYLPNGFCVSGCISTKDAQLMVSAKDLLEALEELYELIADIGGVPDLQYGKITNAASVISRARGQS